MKNENNLIPLSGISNIKTIDCNEITGDLDNNYLVNVVDIIVLVSSIINDNDLEICYVLASDMDFNNELNISDIVSLIQIILQN